MNPRRAPTGLENLRELVSLAFDAMEMRVREDPDYATRLCTVLKGLGLDVGLDTLSGSDPLNPIAVFLREGRERLEAELSVISRANIAAIIAFHGLDPSAATREMTDAELRQFVVRACEERAARDAALDRDLRGKRR
ncbi:MAG: hypothetical protein GWO02_20605 [Gammaproteobacteria bacterium]|nr:hypothetical protein [Gammaproteobacteria bacterium]